MDVNLPDGTVIQGVPEGTTQKQLLQKLYESGHPAYRTLAWQMAKEKPWGSGVPGFANNVGGKVTDALANTGLSPEVAAGAGYTANVVTQAIPALLSGYRTQAAPASFAEGPSKWLMQSAVKPTQADRASGAAGRAMGTMLSEDIAPTVSGMDKTMRVAGKMDDIAETSVAGSPEAVSLNAVGQRLEEPAKRALTQVNPQADIEAVKSVWQAFKDSPLIKGLTGTSQAGSNVPAVLGQAAQDVSIPVQLAHALKKGTYQSLGGKSYGEIGSASTEAQKALARGLREEVAAAVPQAAEALKREASLMNVKDVAMNRVLAEANKNPMGLGALRIGDNPLSTAGFVADRSAYIKGLLARLLYRGAQPQMLMPEAAAGQAVESTLHHQ